MCSTPIRRPRMVGFPASTSGSKVMRVLHSTLMIDPSRSLTQSILSLRVIQEAYLHIRSLNMVQQMARQITTDAYTIIMKLLAINLRVNSEVREDFSVPRGGLDCSVGEVGADHFDHRLL